LALNKTCRYCPFCDLLIARKDEIDASLATFFAQHQPDVVGNDYLVVGTFDRPDWQKGVNAPVPVAEMLDYLHPMQGRGDNGIVVGCCSMSTKVEAKAEDDQTQQARRNNAQRDATSAGQRGWSDGR